MLGAKSARAVLRWTQVSRSMPARSVRRALRSVPKLYIACGISGQIQHTAGMDQSSMIISINTDPDAPINKIADFAITGDLNEVIPKMIKYYKQNSK